MERASGSLATHDDFDVYIGSRAASVFDSAPMFDSPDADDHLVTYLPKHIGKGVADELLKILSAPAGTLRAQWDYEDVCRVDNTQGRATSPWAKPVNLPNFLLAYTGPLLSALHHRVGDGYNHVKAISVRNALPVPTHMDVYKQQDDAYSIIVTLRSGDVLGGDLVFPQYRFAINAVHGSVVIMRSNVWHGNSLIKLAEGAERTSFVIVVTRV